jgi:Transposase DDE domain group 1
VNSTLPLFDVGELVERPARAVAPVQVTVRDEAVTGVAGVVLWGEMLDRLNLVGVADARGLRPIGASGYSGGECYRALTEVLLAGGDFLSDCSLLSGTTQQLRGVHRLPSHSTLWRFCAGADLGRAHKAAAVNRTMLARAWAMGAGPPEGLITIDPDATIVDTYGPGKHGSTHSYKGETSLSPLIGVCGETGDVLALRARGGNAHPGRDLAGFIRECVAAIPAAVRERSNLWVRIDSAGYQHEVFNTAERLGAFFTITARQHDTVKAAMTAVAADPATVWVPALNSQSERGSEITETLIAIRGRYRPAATQRTLRLIVRRQPTRAGEQLTLDDPDGWRLHAIVTNIPSWMGPADMIEAHHRRRGGIPEDTIRQLKEDFGLEHAPLENFYANWLWWHACALAYNVARWIRVLALPASFHRSRGKRLRLAFFNVAASVVSHARQLWLRLPSSHHWATAFIEALTRIRQLPAYA